MPPGASWLEGGRLVCTPKCILLAARAFARQAAAPPRLLRRRGHARCRRGSTLAARLHPLLRPSPPARCASSALRPSAARQGLERAPPSQNRRAPRCAAIDPGPVGRSHCVAPAAASRSDVLRWQTAMSRQSADTTEAESHSRYQQENLPEAMRRRQHMPMLRALANHQAHGPDVRCMRELIASAIANACQQQPAERTNVSIRGAGQHLVRLLHCSRLENQSKPRYSARQDGTISHERRNARNRTRLT